MKTPLLKFMLLSLLLFLMEWLWRLTLAAALVVLTLLFAIIAPIYFCVRLMGCLIHPR